MTDFISRTARTPARHYKRRLVVSEHAIERFRERVDEEFRHRDDEDLSNLLDERIGYAEFAYQVDDPRSPGNVTTIRSVACRVAGRDATYYAVVRDETVITVLDEAMARNNFPTWTPVQITPQGLRPLIPPALPPLPPPLPPPAPIAEVTAVIAAVPSTTAEIAEPELADPLAEAGVAYARARRQQHACAMEIAALKMALERATEALLEAEIAVESTHRRLVEVASDGNADTKIEP